MSLRDSFGKPKEGGQYKIITVGEDESKVVRFFPPMKSYAPKGLWARYVQQHYGYGVNDKKNPGGKLRLRPFECVEEKEESGLVTSSCPECRNSESQEQAEKDAIAVRSSDMARKGSTQAEIAAEVANIKTAFADYAKSHNLDRKWFIPVKTEDGTFGLLKIPHKGKKAIDKVRGKEKGKKKSVDMLDLDVGFWVKVSRSGTGLKTEYDAEAVTETRHIEGVGDIEVIKTAALSEADLEQALASIPDLGSPILFRHLTKDQIQMIVDSKGNPDVVETVMNMSQKIKTADSSAVDEGDDEAPTPAAAKPVEAPAPAVQKPAPAVTQTLALAEVDEEAELMKQLAAARAAKAAKAAATQPAPATSGIKPTLPATGSPLDPSMSDDEFMKRYGPGSTTASAR